MIIRLRFLGAFLLLACSSAFACSDGKLPTKIVFSDSVDQDMSKPDFTGEQVCLNLKQADDMLNRKPIGAKDANSYWSIPINLGKQEEVRHIYWPGRVDLLAQFTRESEGPYPDGAGTTCALVGSVSLFRATRLKLAFDHLEPGTLQELYVSTSGFEYLPNEHPPTMCLNIDSAINPKANEQLQFKVSRRLQDGKLVFLFRNNRGAREQVVVDFDGLIKAAEDSKIREERRRAVPSATSIGALANNSFNAGAQIKVEGGYISVTYVEPQ
ncbi:MAG: hypothetical protein QM808_00350 [Steroidobacteraceae bacterium]